MGKGYKYNANNWSYDGAIFLCNGLTKKECFAKKLFGLSANCVDFVKKLKAGTTLFLYEVEQRKLHGVFEATSDGAWNIIPDAFMSSLKFYPAQIRFKRIWFCKPLSEFEFRDTIIENYYTRNKFSHGLSHQQVSRLLHLFSSRNRLQLAQYPRLQDELPMEFEMSSLVNQTDIQTSSNSSSHSSFRSPRQTCSSSTVSEHTASLSNKLTNRSSTMSFVHREPYLDISDVPKSNSLRSTEEDTDTVAVPGSQEENNDQSTDDFIPLLQEEKTLESIHNLSVMLKAESYSSESKGSSDSEEFTPSHQSCDKKDDGYYPPMVNSKLRSDIEKDRTSVFSRLVGAPTNFSQRKKSRTKACPSVHPESFNLLSQRRQQWKTHSNNKPFPCDADEILDMPSAKRLSGGPAWEVPFTWDDDKRSSKFSGGNMSRTHMRLGPFVCEDGKKWDVSVNESSGYDACQEPFVYEGVRTLIKFGDRELNIPPVVAGAHEHSGINTEKKIGIPSLDFKLHVKDPSIGGGDQDAGSEADEESARKKRRLASASFPQEEYQIDTSLVLEGSKTIDLLEICDGSSEDKNIFLSSNETCTLMATAYLENNVLLHDEQQQSIQGCCEVVIADTVLVESSETSDVLPNLDCRNKKSFSYDGSESQVPTGEPEMSLQEKQCQSVNSCHEIVNSDKVFLLEHSKIMDISPSHDGDCRRERSLTSDGTGRATASQMETEMPLQEKQIQSIQSCCEVVNGGEVLVLENSETMEMLPKLDGECRNKSLLSDETHSHVATGHLEAEVSLQGKQYQSARSWCEAVNVDTVLILGNSETMDLPSKCDGDSGKDKFSFDGSGGYVATDHMESSMSLQKGQYKSIQSCGQIVASETMLALENSKPMDNLETSDGDGGNKGDSLPSNVTCTGLDSDHMETTLFLQEEACQVVQICQVVPKEATSVLESSVIIGIFPTYHGDCANKNSLSDETSASVATDHQDTNMFSQDKQYLSSGSHCREHNDTFNESCHGVILEHVVTDMLVQSEQHNGSKSFCDVITSGALLLQKNSETMDSVTQHSCREDNRNTTNIFPSIGVQSFVPPDDYLETEALLQEEQHQNLRSWPDTAHENSNPMDSFAGCAEGCGSKSVLSAHRTCAHQ